MEKNAGFSTILVARFRQGADALIRMLNQEGYLVLNAEDGPAAVNIARVHSRAIHLMLTDDNNDSRALASIIKQYRPKMRVLYVSERNPEGTSDVVTSDLVMAKVRDLINPSTSVEFQGSKVAHGGG